MKKLRYVIAGLTCIVLFLHSVEAFKSFKRLRYKGKGNRFPRNKISSAKIKHTIRPRIKRKTSHAQQQTFNFTQNISSSTQVNKPVSQATPPNRPHIPQPKHPHLQIPIPTNGLKGWIKRLGNNIVQITNVITEAQQKNATVYIPKHSSPLLNKIADKVYSYGPNKLPLANYFTGWGADIFNPEKIKTIKDIILPNLNLTPDDNPALANSIVIHIRNGDIWDARQVHRSYLQPPLAYYQAIIEHHTSIDDIVIVMDQNATLCPVAEQLFNYLKNTNKRVHFIPNPTLEKDYSTLVVAPKVLVLSNGTWATTISALNYVLTQSIQYKCNFTLEDKPNQDYQPGRKRTILIGGLFGKEAYHLNRKGTPKQKVRPLYNTRAIAYFPKTKE